MQAEVLVEKAQGMVRGTTRHHRAGFATAHEQPFRGQVSKRTAHGADSDAEIPRQLRLPRKYRAGLPPAKQDELRHLPLHLLVERHLRVSPVSRLRAAATLPPLRSSIPACWLPMLTTPSPRLLPISIEK
jgi:hypothetical protein